MGMPEAGGFGGKGVIHQTDFLPFITSFHQLPAAAYRPIPASQQAGVCMGLWEATDCIIRLQHYNGRTVQVLAGMVLTYCCCFLFLAR